MSTTAKVFVSHVNTGDETTLVGFSADYNDGVNKAWSKWTPTLALQMTVKNEIADQFPYGRKFTLTFNPED